MSPIKVKVESSDQDPFMHKMLPVDVAMALFNSQWGRLKTPHFYHQFFIFVKTWNSISRAIQDNSKFKVTR